ncbi:MAG: hypothetical protein K2M48_05150, partial [Clostridiales bacterium]|nr:hypothetical protein [Clostridiales bacterium]
EIVLAVIPFLLVLIWGNILSLCLMVPVVGGIVGGAAGGAVGGGISALISILGLVGMRCVKPAWLKVLIGIAAIGIAFGICCGLGYAFLI